ncbi:hypothetical protein D3C85_1167020 [compost metagenome]
MNEHAVIIKTLKHRGQAFTCAEQNTLILHRQPGITELVQRSPEHFHPLTIPERPEVFLVAVDRSHQSLAVLTVPREQSFYDLVFKLFPAVRRSCRGFDRHTAQALNQQDIGARMFFVGHNAINGRHSYRAASRQHGHFPRQLSGDAR